MALAVYAPTLSFELVYDDHVQIERNPRLREPGALGRLFVEPVWGFYKERGAVVSSYYRPLFGALYVLLARVGGAVPRPFHAASVLLHAVVSVLVAWVGLRLVPPERAGPAALVAGLVFAAHPVHAEAVAWVGAQADLLCGVFAIAALGLHLGSAADKKSLGGEGRSWVHDGFEALLYLASCLSKETGVALLLVLAAIEVPRGWRGLRRLVPYGLALLVYLGLRVQALGGFAPGGGGEVSPALAGSLLGRYLAHLAVPFPPRVLAPVAEPAPWVSAWGIAGLVGAAVLVWVAWRWRERREIAVPVAFLLALLLPALAAGASAGGAVFAERYLYLPSVGLAWLAGSLASRWVLRPGVRRLAATAILAILIAGCGLLAWRRAEAYRDDLALFGAVVAGSPESATARNNLGAALAARGDLAGAARQYKEAIRLDPAAVEAWSNLGALRAAAGDPAGAMAAYGEALRRAPRDAAAAVGLARLHREAGNEAEAARRLDALLAAGSESYDALVERALLYLREEPEAALPLLDRAVGARPEVPRGWYILAQARYNRGELAEAERAALAAVARGAGPGPRRLLARIRYHQGDSEGARRWLEEALRGAPGDLESREMLRSLQ